MGWSVPTWTLGDRLRKARHLADLTEAEMADLLGISRTTVYHWERDVTTPQRRGIEAWSKVTEVPASSTALKRK
jgi:transcriptional regulator with XRE-family HTH domain